MSGSCMPGSILVGTGSKLVSPSGCTLVGTEKEVMPKQPKGSDKEKHHHRHHQHPHHHLYRSHTHHDPALGVSRCHVTRPRDELREEVKQRRKMEKELGKKLAKLAKERDSPLKGHGK